MSSSISYANLRAEMARGKVTIQQLADAVRIDRSTMGLKLSGKSPILLHEASLINAKFFPKHNLPYLFQELWDIQNTA